MTEENYWAAHKQELERDLATAEANLAGRDHRAEVKALSDELRKRLPKLLRKAIRKAQLRIVLKWKAGIHSLRAALFLGKGFLKNGRMRLMMYGRPSGNPKYPLGMWLLPNDNDWYGACDFVGLKDERLQRSHPMVLVSFDEGIPGAFRTMYTVYAGRDGFPWEWQLHFDYNFVYKNRTYPMAGIFPAEFMEVSKELDPLLTRYQQLVIAQQETVRRIEERDRAAQKLQKLGQWRETWKKVCLPDDQAIEILKMVELFRDNDPAKPQGLLLKGVPGTGKTLLASVIAELLGCNFVRVSLADLKHPNLGQSGQLVRALWKQAREKAPSVIFVDECESVFGKRGAAETDVVATDVVQTFLSEWNGKDRDVWIIGATNRRDMLDEAIVSRFDREMAITLPNEELRAEILRRELSEIGVAGAVPQEVAKLTQGMSGRDLAQLAKKVRALAHPNMPGRQHFIAAIQASREAGNTPIDKQSSWDTLIVDAATLDKLQTMCAVLRDPEGWRKQGVTIPSGLLLVGPPGTGKTEVARTIANESGLAFFGVTTADVKGPFVGHSVNRVKNLFERARAAAPAIIFLDELDIVAPARVQGQHDTAQEEIVGQLLQEINGIRRQDSHVFLLGATNHPERVDPAILSRLQEQVEIPLPDADCRARFLRLVLDGKKKAFGVEDACEFLVSRSAGMSKRDIRNWISRAEQKAISRASRVGGPEHFSLTFDDFLEDDQGTHDVPRDTQCATRGTVLRGALN